MENRPNPLTALTRTPEEIGDLTRINQLASPLLRLPGEIRNLIYTYACRDTEVKLRAPRKGVYARQRVPSNQRKTLALLFTCKQMRFEATPIFYEQTTFDLRDLGYITLSTLPKKYKHLVTSFGLTFTLIRNFKEGNVRHSSTMRKRMESAKHVTVYVESTSLYAMKLSAHKYLLSGLGWEGTEIEVKKA